MNVGNLRSKYQKRLFVQWPEVTDSTPVFSADLAYLYNMYEKIGEAVLSISDDEVLVAVFLPTPKIIFVRETGETFGGMAEQLVRDMLAFETDDNKLADSLFSTSWMSRTALKTLISALRLKA